MKDEWWKEGAYADWTIKSLTEAIVNVWDVDPAVHIMTSESWTYHKRVQHIAAFMLYEEMWGEFKDE